ncbi:MAG: bifunctional diaminohydroxyphosphoribosylaminopyrimidine deaminase/5-amino-6-(5-phosphoribosylamino)uracil reductase RibD [candidate division WOR-3 bacterium]
MNKLDEYFLRKTFEIAKKGEGLVSPNPLVGACVVKEGILVGEGYHRGPGTPHAEVEAIKKAGDKAKGATLYVSLEPCSHYGNTPPCVELIEKSGIKRVVAPIKDPNPIVNGKGFKFLKRKGIQITTGLLEEEAKKLNPFYLKYIKTGIPYVILKAALSLDGKIGNPEKGIFKITSKDSLKEVHYYRKKVDALLIGVNTVLIDNPELTVRFTKAKKQPLKIIIDPYLKCPKNAKIFKIGGKVIIVTTIKEAKQKYPEAKVWVFKEKRGVIDIREILKKAGEEKITSIMVEGGSETFTHFINSGVVDKYLLFYSPSLIGEGIPFVKSVKKRIFLDLNTKKIGRDILLESE